MDEMLHIPNIPHLVTTELCPIIYLRFLGESAALNHSMVLYLTCRCKADMTYFDDKTCQAWLMVSWSNIPS